MKSVERKKSILIVDDDEALSTVMDEILRAVLGVDVSTNRTGQGVAAEVVNRQINLSLLDLNLSLYNGFAVMEELERNCVSVPVVFITGYSDLSNTDLIRKTGACDLWVKATGYDKLVKLVANHLVKEAPVADRKMSISQIRTRHEENREKSLTPDSLKDKFIGKSPAMQPVFQAISDAAQSSNRTPVLIIGESGSGKELVARQIHMLSANAGAPFIPVNLAAVQDTLALSELFGAEKAPIPIPKKSAQACSSVPEPARSFSTKSTSHLYRYRRNC